MHYSTFQGKFNRTPCKSQDTQGYKLIKENQGVTGSREQFGNINSKIKQSGKQQTSTNNMSFCYYPSGLSLPTGGSSSGKPEMKWVHQSHHEISSRTATVLMRLFDGHYGKDAENVWTLPTGAKRNFFFFFF